MKVLCNTEFVHSNIKFYNAGVTYEITKEEAEGLIAVDKKKDMGALSFFTPVSEDAVEYFNGKKKGSKGEPKAEPKAEPKGEDK